MNISVIGTGYVGLVTGACFAEFGVQVICMDKDERRIGALEKGKIPIYEPGLTELVHKGLSEGRLKFTTDLSRAVESALVRSEERRVGKECRCRWGRYEGSSKD